MIFDDEPVPGYSLPILPGHVSPGRLERVLRAGKFAVTTGIAPSDSADPNEVYERAHVFDGCVDAIIEGVAGVHVMAYLQEETVAEIIGRSGVLEGRIPWYPDRDKHLSQQRALL